MQTAIKVEQLSKSYGNLLAIDQISLSVKYGTVYGLLGTNGAGKSTTIECILGTKKADSGTVSVLGLNPKEDRRRLFQNVGVQFQKTIISRKSRFPSYAMKQPAYTRLRQIGKHFVRNSGSEARLIMQSKICLVENANVYLLYLL